ncbi:hypothetical protein IHE44_0004666 [Lamprotornis superbus]|uniref:Laminin EGF-like domain-containing protein n=1 Tax=Lamprotornis superbus TaxID=245042 RepID=A0A835TYS5_9PASS|nr:hypothetical protein IHE44_0004666 [Lamprotornis superbus]
MKWAVGSLCTHGQQVVQKQWNHCPALTLLPTSTIHRADPDGQMLLLSIWDFVGYACQCSREGSLHGSCDQDTGQCSCRPKVTGLRCDSCVPGAYGFPHCQVGSCNPAGLETADPSLAPGSCACRAYVEGPACDRCKPGYWNLTPENPYGCLSKEMAFAQPTKVPSNGTRAKSKPVSTISGELEVMTFLPSSPRSCKCDTRGTISGITECRQGDGQCFCKASVCGQFCSACRDGYFNMENANYFGCQGEPLL